MLILRPLVDASCATYSNAADNCVLSAYFRSKCVYFTKSNPAKAVDVKTVDSDLLCGEMVGMPLESLQSVITNVYRPLISAQEDWQKCSADQVILCCPVVVKSAWYAI